MLRRTVPKPAAVRLVEPLGPRLPRRHVRVPVQIDGPEPGFGAYLVGTWSPPGRPPVPVGMVNLSAGEPAILDLDLTRLPGGEGCRLEVSYFDGVREATTTQGGLFLPPQAGVPVITSPPAGARIPKGVRVSLAGHLDGDGEASELVWIVDDDVMGMGPAATAADLGIGVHTVTLQHRTTSVALDFTVVAAPVPHNGLPVWQPPWRSIIFRSMTTHQVYTAPVELSEQPVHAG
ncbi:hypothetical protein [Catellatospora chokoriensis]|uniref:hypothetical protein n=1 Tax=Catellatospora chokoriensis TaxID=310353 RepID=UPI00194307E1|nr:hypothetical protein [Catellatospora chokoriensis]